MRVKAVPVARKTTATVYFTPWINDAVQVRTVFHLFFKEEDPAVDGVHLLRKEEDPAVGGVL